jgi:DNA-binding transcriptional MocR family regulator
MDISSLHASLTDSSVASMNMLNEIASGYPEAVSFASGRPQEAFFDVALLHRYLDAYCYHLTDELGYDSREVAALLFQYGRTKGIIADLITRHLEHDEGIAADPESLVVTVGCQEAMFIVMRCLRASDRDVLLAISPVYVGLTGAARLADLPVWPVRSGPDGIDLEDLAAQARRARKAGLRPRACYAMPDFANPSGVSMTESTRRDLLTVAAQSDLLLLEDNPYGLFHHGPRPRTLKALDTRRQVIYLGSFAKIGFPGARVGYVIADQDVTGADGTTAPLAGHLSQIKSMVTVNTSPVAQALIGGKLLLNGCSLRAANRRETDSYVRNLRLLLDGLRDRFPDGSGVTWNTPAGGFFAVVTLPFPADDEALAYCAREHGVLWMPMSHFYVGDGGTYQARLACSQLSPDQITAGLDRFAAFVADKS